MGDFRKLDVWQQSHALVVEIYSVTRSFPSQERYGLTAQMRRSAVSVPANIAEGCGRHLDTELARFLRISLGSATELEYHLLLAGDLGLIDPLTLTELTKHVRKVQGMLVKLGAILRRHSP
jgi:four helix bundle protein